MDKLSKSKRIISEKPPCNKARLDCFVRMLVALFSVRTANLSELAVGFSSKAEINTRYRRFPRFFAQFKIDYTITARFIFKGC